VVCQTSASLACDACLDLTPFFSFLAEFAVRLAFCGNCGNAAGAPET